MGETDCVECCAIRGSSAAVSGDEASSGFAILSGPSERSAMTLRLSSQQRRRRVRDLEKGGCEDFPVRPRGASFIVPFAGWLAGKGAAQVESVR
jgi:hypothetical protein